ncbi:serine/arginine-rich splicing factor 6-like isoform X2 [Cynara cardunculus var. scolymus]|uniref:serine/arginine-rich splicing factor 6-like isoform X2 n=1 Tax=Cynara cardunculus var. scolymus TaxID=59895 RepID=UPI000D6316EE|nr:serine/arginine-rich splicing factor 6-like isoform X2 [Cynara cardunculus var. scolymus]
MSLHLGNLSSRVRRDELERVFRRFGRCSIQVRDKFGFVVYDYPVNAERALKTLRGKKICGELLILSWSNRQPRPVPRVRGGKSYVSRQGRNSRKENYVKGKLSSDGRQDSRMGYKQPDTVGRIFSPADEPEDATNCDPDNAETYGMKEELADTGVGPSENFLENDRWEEQIDDPPNANELEDVSEFDRYEPYGDEDKRDDDEINHDVHQGGSPTVEVVPKRKGVVQMRELGQQGCYNCGELGHKMRNCPQERASKKKLNRFDHKRNDKSNYIGKGEDELRRIKSDSRGRERPSRNAVTIRSHKGSREVPSYRKHHRTDCSPADNGINNERIKRTRESESPERHRARKSRRPNSSPIYSDGKLSRSKSCSKYSQPTTRSRSRSRSGSRSRSSSHASLYVSTSSVRSSTPSLTKAASAPQKEVDTGFENPKLDTMDTNHIQKCEEDTHLDDGVTESIRSPTSQRGTPDLKEERVTAMVNHESEDDSRSEKRSSKSMIITSEEMLMVIKHYGLKQDERTDDKESYFGCGRLWPWEVIYYRRLKKGAISTENYARRISQNREFGIVDKYVRSSSGWGEEVDKSLHSA